MENQQNWWQLTSIQLGGVICLPVILIGQTLYQTYGFTSSLIGIILGNLILLMLGFIMIKMSCERRKSTPANAADYFGKVGVASFALTMCLSLLGWYAIQLNMMSLSIFDLFHIDPSKTYVVVLANLSMGFVTTLGALYGIKSLNILANISLPLLLITLGYAFFTVDYNPASTSLQTLSFSSTSIVIALAIALIIDLPTYYRHSKTTKDGLISLLLIFVFALPILEFIGVYLAAGSQGGHILDILKGSHGPLWNLWVALFLILAGWTTNNLNLYSGVVCLESLLKNTSDKTRTLLFGIAGSLLSCFNFLAHLEFILDLMGIFVAGMGSVIMTRYLMEWSLKKPVQQRDHKWHVFAWILGVVVGILSIGGYSLTAIPLLDATIAASLGTWTILFQKESCEKAYSA